MKNQKLKLKPLIFVIALILVVSVGLTTAYYYNNSSIKNDFKLSDYSMKIMTNLDESACVFNDSLEDETNHDTNLSITNNGNEDVLLRFYYVENFYNTSDGTKNNIFYNGTEIVTKNWNNDLNDFIYKDGWYYYTKVLDKNETINILDSVTYNIEESSEFKDTSYDIKFKYEVLQVDHNPSEDVWGHKANINGNEVSWEF